MAYRLGLLPAREMLLAPRGELSSGALGIKSAKKRAFLHVWAPLLRGINPVWNASSEVEQADIHRFFPGVRTVIQTDGGGDEAREEIIRSSERARFVFISRISEMKNLLLALQALGAVRVDADFDIYGPVEDIKYWRQCQRVIADLPRNVRATYLGELRPNQVKDTFAKYDAFILPTRGENFGHVIAESLSSGCPVICSQRTPWTEVLLQGGVSLLINWMPRRFPNEIAAWAKRTSPQRDTAKRDAMTAYIGWQMRQETISAVELTLDGVLCGNATGSDSNASSIGIVKRGFLSAKGVRALVLALGTVPRDISARWRAICLSRIG